MEDNRKELEYHTTEYLLNLTCTYKEFIEFVEKKFPNSIIDDEDGEPLEIRLPSDQWASWRERTFPGIKPKIVNALFFSYIRFEVLSRNPLDLKGTHYWIDDKYFIDDKSQDTVRKFIALVNNYYGRIDTVSSDQDLPKPIPKIRTGPKPKLSDDEKYQIVNNRYKDENASLTLNQYLDNLSRENIDLDKMIDENQFYEMRTYLIKNGLLIEKDVSI